ncbi:hypothetical protein IWX91DRAFT_318701 [Phyllosticta citricarpa]
MPRPFSIDDHFQEQEETYNYFGLSQQEKQDAIDKIALHWGQDYLEWLPSSVELLHLAPLAVHLTQMSTVKAKILLARNARLARPSHSAAIGSEIKSSDVVELRAELQFIADIMRYWNGNIQNWVPKRNVDWTTSLEVDNQSLCGLALLAQISSVGCVDRPQQVHNNLAGKVREMQGLGGHPTPVEIFEALRNAKRTWLRGKYIAVSFYHKTMENAVWKLGSAYGTSEFGATIMFDTHAGSGVSTKTTKGGFWNLESEHARAPIARLWTDKKIAENLDLIRKLEKRHKEHLAMIFDAPELQVREALAIPTALLNRIVTLAREFALSLHQL